MIRDCVEIVSLLSIVCGAYLAWPPLGFIVAGAAGLFVVGITHKGHGNGSHR